MYDKIIIEQSMDINELCSYLEMNGYDFERIHNHLYVFEEQTEDVQQIMDDRNIQYECSTY